MTQRSMTDCVDAAQLTNGSVTTTQTPTTGVDLQGYYKAEIFMALGTVANINTSPGPGWTFTVQHSDAAASGFAAVADTDLVMPAGATAPSDGVVATVDDSADDDTTYHVGYVGGKRYVRVISTAVSTPGTTPLCVFVVREKLLVSGD